MEVPTCASLSNICTSLRLITNNWFNYHFIPPYNSLNPSCKRALNSSVFLLFQTGSALFLIQLFDEFATS